jgi:8-oxo-dGTP diphosphatase
LRNARPHLQVACAIIEKDGLVLAARRGPDGSMPGRWEFPGGKVAAGESPAQALHRELMEELSVKVRVLCALPPHSHHYPEFTVTLHPFVCRTITGPVVLREHSEARWLAPGEMAGMDWAEADVPVIAEYLEWRGRGNTRGRITTLS